MPFGKGNVAEARRYIIGVADFKKPVADLSDRYVTRVANQFERQIKAGLPPSLQGARGHATREKGRSPKHLPAPASAYKAAHKRANPLKLPSSRHKVRGQAVKVGRIKFHRLVGADLPEFLAQASKIGGRQRRLKVSFKDRHGVWHTLGQKGGIKLSTLRHMAKRSGDSLSDLIEALWQMSYDTDEDVLPDDPADLEIELFSVTLGNA